MADLGDIVEEFRTMEGNTSGREDENDSTRRGSTKRKRSRRRRNSGGSQGSAQPSPSGQVREEDQEETEGDGENIQQYANGQNRGVPLIQEDHEARFYAEYRKVADEYDKDFLKKYDEDLTTTLIFAGLFSAVTSAFIIEVDSKLKPDPGDETAALLRVLIYEINNAALGGNIPTVPQWTGPPPTMIHVQAILFASLVASLLSAFLAMLGKQWLNRYASADMRGSAAERSQNRQRKLDGIIAWYFNHVMESLPLMLQAALLLLGCALSRYLWEVSTTVALVVICLTSFGVLFYVFITVAGAASESCPYRTPGSHILRHLGLKVWRKIHSARLSVGSATRNTSELLPDTDNIPIGAYHFFRSVGGRLHSMYSTLIQGLIQEAIQSHLRCISWTLQTSLDKPVHLAALKHLWTMTDLTGLDPTLVANCLNAFLGCVNFNNNKLVVLQGWEELAEVSVGCFFRTFHHLSITDPNSSVLVDIRRRYDRAFPFETDFRGLPFYHTMLKTHELAGKPWNHHNFKWDDYGPSGQEHVLFSRSMVEVVQLEYQRTQPRQVPAWVLHFALRSLSLDPPSPASVVADCLTIVAIDLGCDVSNITTPDESARVERVSSLITQKLKTMLEPSIVDAPLLEFKGLAIGTLFPYALHLEQGGQPDMIDLILRADRASPSVLASYPTRSLVRRVFDESSPPSLNRIIVLMSSHLHWFPTNKGAIARWTAAASAVPYSEEVGQVTVDVVLQILGNYHCKQFIPDVIWSLLKKRPSLPPVCRGRSIATLPFALHHIQGLGDIEILKSYFLLVWSEWDPLQARGLAEVHITIRECFGGIKMWCDRADLIKHLDHVQRQLDQGLECFKQHLPAIDEGDIQERKEQYAQLKDTLLAVDHGAMETLARSHLNFGCAMPLPFP